MSLCPEAAAFLGTPRVTVPVSKSVRLLTGGEPSEEAAADTPKFIKSNEDTMPKTSTTEVAKPKRKYTRRQPAGCAARIEDAPPPKKPRKPRQEKLSGVVFSVDSTGALLIRRGEHGMEFSREEVLELNAFIGKAEAMWGEK